MLDDALVIWGGGVKPGIALGTRLTYKYQDRHFRLTNVHGNVVKQILRVPMDE